MAHSVMVFFTAWYKQECTDYDLCLSIELFFIDKVCNTRGPRICVCIMKFESNQQNNASFQITFWYELIQEEMSVNYLGLETENI
jgi:hypothetical protein